MKWDKYQYRILDYFYTLYQYIVTLRHVCGDNKAI